MYFLLTTQKNTCETLAKKTEKIDAHWLTEGDWSIYIHHFILYLITLHYVHTPLQDIMYTHQPTHTPIRTHLHTHKHTLHTHTETHKQTHTETQTQTDTDTHKHTYIESEREREGERETWCQFRLK